MRRKEKPEALPMTVAKRNGITVLRHATENNLVYLRANFNASDLKLEELPVLVTLSMLLGNTATQRRSGEQLQMLVKQKIGRLSFQPNVLPGSDSRHCLVMMAAGMTCMESRAQDAAALLMEIWNETVFTDRRLLREMLNQAAISVQMSLPANGHLYALTRVGACTTAFGAAKDYVSGTALVMWLKQLSAADDAALDRLLADLERMAHQIFTAERLTLSCSENTAGSVLDSIALPMGGAVPEEACYTPLGSRQEGLVIPAAVGFAGKGTNLKLHGKAFNGHLPVLANVLNFDYLWNQIRVQGGAYGCGFVSRDDGTVCFYTYRDPQPDRSLDVMDGASAFLRKFCADTPNLTGFILSAVSMLDPLMNTEEKITAAENRYFKHVGYDEMCRRYTELLSTTPADLLALCEILDEIAADNNVCVVAGRSQIDDCGGKLTIRQSM